ncbi:MAG: carbon-nitrogen hydrolase [Gammaproteobacteria bacterium]|nr:carbon-nitrogen hydrolase [Gammaproteobacteria bacterium]
MKIGLVQHVCAEDQEQNISASIQGIEALARQGAKVVVLPELHRTLYFCQTEETRFFDLAETIPGPSTTRFSEIAKAHQVIIVTSLFERRTAGIYHNTAVVIDTNGEIAGMYRKMHIPDDPGYYEKFYFTPGDLGFAPIKTSLGKIGVLVCWDQWYPEAARLSALAGADFLVIPTAIGWNPDDTEEEQQRQREAWITIQRAHAIANGLPLVSCNRTGVEKDTSGQTPGIKFWGSSFIAGPQGEILAQCPTDKTGAIAVNIDLDRNEQVRRIWPYFRDRRIDAYKGIVKRYCD